MLVQSSPCSAVLSQHPREFCLSANPNRLREITASLELRTGVRGEGAAGRRTSICREKETREDIMVWEVRKGRWQRKMKDKRSLWCSWSTSLHCRGDTKHSTEHSSPICKPKYRGYMEEISKSVFEKAIGRTTDKELLKQKKTPQQNHKNQNHRFLFVCFKQGKLIP